MAAPSIPSEFPAFLVANTTWQWTQALYDQASGDQFVPGSGATATIYLNGRYSIEFAASDNGDGTWLFSLAPGASPGTDDILAEGVYRWRILGVLSSKTYDLGSGVITVYANPDVAAAFDFRSHAEKMLALIEAELQARVLGTGSAHESYTIGTRTIAKLSVLDLQKLRNQYAAEVAIARYGKLPDVEAYFVRA